MTQSDTSQKNIADQEAFRGQHPRRPGNNVSKANWKDEFGKIKFCQQRQDSLNDQLKDLILIANRMGFYDAADFIKNHVKPEKQEFPIAKTKCPKCNSNMEVHLPDHIKCINPACGQIGWNLVQGVYSELPEFVEVFLICKDLNLQELYDYLMEHKDYDEFIVHCFQGISRSGAVGEFMNELFGEEWREFKLRNMNVQSKL